MYQCLDDIMLLVLSQQEKATTDTLSKWLALSYDNSLVSIYLQNDKNRKWRRGKGESTRSQKIALVENEIDDSLFVIIMIMYNMFL